MHTNHSKNQTPTPQTKQQKHTHSPQNRFKTYTRAPKQEHTLKIYTQNSTMDNEERKQITRETLKELEQDMTITKTNVTGFRSIAGDYAKDT